MSNKQQSTFYAKKPLVFNEFGNKSNYLSPNYHCLIEPDKNLVSYYNSVLNQPFNLKRFRRPGVFRKIGKVEDTLEYSEFNSIRCLDMPIKMAGSNEYKIPLEFKQFIATVSQMIAFEHGHNSDILDFYAYLTIDQTNPGNSEYHREPGLHVDGFQGSRIQPKVRCDRSYIVFDNNCPSIWNQSFETVEFMDPAKQNVFYEFDRTKHWSSEIRPNPYDITFIDSYLVHSANKIEDSKPRTFVRLSYSVRQFDRKGNSKNNCFDYSWEMFSRNISKELV